MTTKRRQIEWLPGKFLLLTDSDYINVKKLNMHVALKCGNYSRLAVDSIIMKMMGDSRDVQNKKQK